ncbi:hypothetical protein [Pseudomonas carnis]|nr:hypothetical protein [Pseudomonas carnis]
MKTPTNKPKSQAQKSRGAIPASLTAYSKIICEADYAYLEH